MCQTNANVALPEPFQRSTAKFLLWLNQYVLPERKAFWNGKGVAEILAAGGLHYRWAKNGNTSILSLVCGDGAHAAHRPVDCDGSHPPLLALLGCWYDLCLEIGAVSEGEHEAVNGQIEEQQRHDPRHQFQ